MLNFDNKIWKPISQYEDYYLVSKCGCVYSIKRKKYLKPQKGIHYLQVQLNKDGYGLTKTIHRLVAEAFIQNPNLKPEVNHIDGNKLNNNVCNLEWVTSSENSLHALFIGLQKPTKPQKGKKLGNSSKYHNVLRDRNKWKARVKNDGKVLVSKNFDTEEAAALYVNYIIDLHKLDRPKNVIN